MSNLAKVTEDLLQNEDFVAYMQKSPQANFAYWDQWIADHPELREYVEESMLILEELSRKKEANQLPPERIDTLWDDLADRLE